MHGSDAQSLLLSGNKMIILEKCGTHLNIQFPLLLMVGLECVYKLCE